MDRRASRHPHRPRRWPAGTSASLIAAALVLAACGDGASSRASAAAPGDAGTSASAGTSAGSGTASTADAPGATATADAAGTGAPVELDGTDWRLDTVLEGESASNPPTGVVVTLRIDGGQLDVSAGCNNGSAPVAATDGQLNVGSLLTTEKACDAEVMAIEQHVMKVLASSPRFEIDGGRLRLRSGAGTGLEFTPG